MSDRSRTPLRGDGGDGQKRTKVAADEAGRGLLHLKVTHEARVEDWQYALSVLFRAACVPLMPYSLSLALIERREEMSLFACPDAANRRTYISRPVSVASAVCLAISPAASA
jgi:hypothetical protein